MVAALDSFWVVLLFLLSLVDCPVFQPLWGGAALLLSPCGCCCFPPSFLGVVRLCPSISALPPRVVLRMADLIFKLAVAWFLIFYSQDSQA